MHNSTTQAPGPDEALAAKFDVQALEPRLEAAAGWSGGHDDSSLEHANPK